MDRRRLPDPRRILPREYILRELGPKTRLHALVIVVTLIAATLLFAVAENYPLVDSLYFVVLIMTLIGANYTPVTLGGKAIAIVVALVSVGVLISFIAQVLGPSTLSRFWEGLKTRRVTRMRNHIVLCGFSDTVRVLLRNLPKEEVLVIVKDTQTAEALNADGIACLRGDYESEDILRHAGVAESRAVVAASVEDSENAFICLTAKRIAGRVPVLATVSSEENERKLQDVKADRIISPALLSAAAIMNFLRGSERPKMEG